MSAYRVEGIGFLRLNTKIYLSFSLLLLHLGKKGEISAKDTLCWHKDLGLNPDFASYCVTLGKAPSLNLENSAHLIGLWSR